ncbi:hypothetical protein H0H92_011639 [Tricholoma furcatifolium]|nr:hypothetical protein H0H92_011639 [Tricholoma furcatifolium]
MTASRLVEFSTCEISDALIKLNIPHGGLIPDILEMFPVNRICGPAYTVRMVDVSDTSAPKLTSHFVDTTPPGSIVFIDAPARSVAKSTDVKNAVWGGLMSAGARARSAVGVIISGRCRDLAEQESLNFAVFARGRSTLGQSPFTRPSEINIPLTIHPQKNTPADTSFPPVTVEPGDWLIADRDGVVCVPKALEFQVIELATKGREVDELCMRDIQAGQGVEVTFRAHRGK